MMGPANLMHWMGSRGLLVMGGLAKMHAIGAGVECNASFLLQVNRLGRVTITILY
jgi:hypothetical protein